MRHLAKVRRLLRLRTGRSAREEVDAELRFHLDARVDALTRAGVDADAARMQALREFGDVAAASAELEAMSRRRERRTIRAEWWDELRYDLRYALRTLRRQPLFTAAVLLTLALGIGANTAMFTIINATWLGWMRAFPEPRRLVVVFQTFPQGRGSTSPEDFRDWRRENRSLESIAALFNQSMTIAPGPEPERVRGAAVSPEIFRVLRVRPLIGRLLLPGEEVWGEHRVAVLGEALWRRSFGGDPRVVGRMVPINGEPYRIVGILPAGAWFDNTPAELFTPMAFRPNDPINDRGSHFVWVIGRLAAGVSLERANADLQAIARRLAERYPENQGSSASVEPLRDVLLGDTGHTLRLLLAAVLLVLLVSCANVAGLLLVRGAARERELAIRAAIGAGRARLARQLLTETVLLATLGGAIGIAAAAWIVRIVPAHLAIDLPRVQEMGLALDWRVLATAAAVSLSTGVLCGVLPAFQLTRRRAAHEANEILRGARGAGATGGRPARRLRSALVAGEMAMAVTLLVGAGLLTRSLLHLQRVDTGVRPDHVLSLRLALPRSRTADVARTITLYDEITRGLEAIPGVRAAGVTSHLPLGGGGESKKFVIEGRPPATSLADVPHVSGRMESARSLQAMGVTLNAGRWFTDADNAAAPFVAIVSEEVVRRFFPNETPIGKRVVLHSPEYLLPASDLPPGGRWPRWTIVGVVKDVRYTGLRDSLEAVVYVPHAQGRQHWDWGPQWVVVQAVGEPAALTASVRRTLRAIDPTLPLGDVRTLRERIGLVLRGPRFTTSVVALFAAMALLLGAIGLYGVVAYSVAQETRDIGIRLALGASPGVVLAGVLGRGARVALAGIGVGLLAAAAGSRLLAAQLFGVGSLDPLTYGVVAGILAVIAVGATWVPARRATRVDPVSALRGD